MWLNAVANKESISVSLSFGRESRLRSSADFKQVFDTTDIKVSSRQLLILAKANKLGRARLGLVVAKKNIRTAVGRNRAKRHIRETFRLQQDEIGNLDIVVLVRKGFSDLNDRDLNQLLNQQWQRLKRRLHEWEASA
nr:ribonuclease P protein component [Endozoicomonas sp. SESOKO1]